MILKVSNKISDSCFLILKFRMIKIFIHPYKYISYPNIQNTKNPQNPKNLKPINPYSQSKEFPSPTPKSTFQNIIQAQPQTNSTLFP